MKNMFIVLGVLLCASTSVANDISVRPLFDENTFRSHLAIPFKLTSPSMTINSIDNVSIDNPNCRVMIDYHKKDTFLVKCGVEGSATVSIIFKANGTSQALKYGPFALKKITNSSSVKLPSEPSNPGTPTDPGSPMSPEEIAFIKGKEIFEKRMGGYYSCADCHSAGEKSKVALPSQLESALKNNPAMKGRTIYDAKALTREELEWLSEYIETSGR